MRYLIWFTLSLPLWASGPPYRGMTVSCQGYGRIWGSDAFAAELDRLKQLGVNSITIHPYAAIRADGTVAWREWAENNPHEYIVRPIREAHARGLTIMIKPHLAYWGSPFSWRGAIKFDRPEERARFYQTYRRWILAMARATKHADIFVVGTELKHKTVDESQWRELIAEIRKVTPAKLTYAANWDHFHKVPFWDDLDLIGVQGYFPITEVADPDEKALRAGWERVLAQLNEVRGRFTKPVVYTEFGYNSSSRAAAEPWTYQVENDSAARDLQARCLKVGLEVIAEQSDWLHGAFLWKWFVGSEYRANFRLDTPWMMPVIQNAWRAN